MIMQKIMEVRVKIMDEENSDVPDLKEVVTEAEQIESPVEGGL